MRDRACFVRMYGEITPELSRVDYRPYRRSNRALSYLFHDIDHARYEVPYAQELSTYIWGPCYNSTLCATGINVLCGTGNILTLGFDSKSRHLALYQRKVMSEELIMDEYRTDH